MRHFSIPICRCLQNPEHFVRFTGDERDDRKYGFDRVPFCGGREMVGHIGQYEHRVWLGAVVFPSDPFYKGIHDTRGYPGLRTIESFGCP